MQFEGGRRLVFVGGAPRSGTTLLQNHLDSHPMVAGGPEFDNVPKTVELFAALRSSVRSGRIEAFLDEEDAAREIGFLLERLLLPYADKHGAERLSEKTPWNVLVFRELLAILPEARFLFCVRDPRAVIASMLAVGDRARRNAQPLSPAFTRWTGAAIRCVQRCNAAGFAAWRAAPDRVMVVRYEDLVLQTHRETQRICEHVGIAWDERIAKPGQATHDGQGQIDNVWYTEQMYRADPDPARLERWRETLTWRQQAMISVGFGGDADLRAAGYALTGEEGLALGTRVVARAERALSELGALMHLRKLAPVVLRRASGYVGSGGAQT